jgi:limonene-1,2-epoxide hydrolase
LAVNQREIFERYIYLGPLTRNADAVAEMFTADGIFEAPLVPPGHVVPQRLAGREEIRTGLTAYYERSSATRGTVNVEKSRYVLHTTSDPDIFIAEIDTVIDGPAGSTTRSLVQIFRLQDGKIAHLRDYFSPDQAD